MNNILLIIVTKVKLQNAKLNLTCGKKSSSAWLVAREDFIIFGSSESFNWKEI
jgi:hypothetical protein